MDYFNKVVRDWLILIFRKKGEPVAFSFFWYDDHTK
jgi:hypothetical protein